MFVTFIIDIRFQQQNMVCASCDLKNLPILQ